MEIDLVVRAQRGDKSAYADIAAEIADRFLAVARRILRDTTLATGSLDPINLNVKTGAWKAQIRTKGQTDLTVVENRVAPGGTFGWHSHPGPSLIIVKSGTISFYRADDPTCTPEIYSVGDAYVDEGADVHVGRNEGIEEVVLLVTRLLPAGASPRIDAPDPGFCGF